MNYTGHTQRSEVTAKWSTVSLSLLQLIFIFSFSLLVSRTSLYVLVNVTEFPSFV
jgi:hypothetical protein